MRSILFVFLCVTFFSCQNKEEQEEVDALFKELIHGHDVVMPLSMKLPKLSASILESVQNLEETDSTSILAHEIALDLTLANDDMYTWMDNLAIAMNDIKDLGEKSKQYKVLNEEISLIDSMTVLSISNAEKFLKDNE